MSPAEQTAAADTAPGTATAVKADTLQVYPVKEFALGRPTIGCRFDSLGRYVFAGAEDYLVRRCDLASGKVVSLPGHESWVRAIASTSDGRTSFTGGYDGRIIWWPTADEQPAPIRVVQAHHGWVRSLAVSPDGKLLASGGNDKLVKIWNVADGTLVRELAGHARHVYCVLFHPTGQFLVSGDLKGVIKQWDPTSVTVVREFAAPTLFKYDATFHADVGGIRAMAFSPDGKLLGCCGMARIENSFAGVGFPELVSFDWDSGKEKQQHRSKERIQGTAWNVKFHPNGFWIVGSGGQSGGHLFFWKPDAEQEFFKFQMPDTIHDLDMHPDGLRLAAAHQGGQVRIYSMAPKPKA